MEEVKMRNESGDCTDSKVSDVAPAVKTEPPEVNYRAGPSIERGSTIDNEPVFYFEVKIEPLDVDDVCSSEVSSCAEPTGAHATTVKQEMDMEPGGLQPPDNMDMLPPRKLQPGEDDPPRTRLKQKISAKAETISSTDEGNQSTNASKRPHGCSICKKTFTYKSKLKIHAMTHTSERPYCCSICPKTFTCKGSLDYHTMTHTGERPNTCSICQKAFISKTSLKLHTMTHTGERPHSCSICPKAFISKRKLDYHHTMTHKGERPHKCSICPKAFTDKINLDYHTVTHTGEWPHVCSICKKAFTGKSSLKTHSMTHTASKQ